MAVYQLDPIQDTRWAALLEQDPRASVFHAPGWLEALRRTFGYQPVVYTTTPPGHDLTNGIVLCRVHSRITGRRLVSLPFSDHCEPLVERPADLDELLDSLRRECSTERYQYLEIRPRSFDVAPSVLLEASQKFFFHALPLQRGLAEIFRAFHKDSIQRKISRAKREQLIYEEGSDKSFLEKFYAILLRTCRRRRLPPHPRKWFYNLVECLGDNVKIRIASKNGHPIASIVTLRQRDVLVYKYGCSDPRFHNLGGMQLLFWNAIQEGVKDGMRELDLGRSDLANSGLIIFKDRWDATRSQMTYWRSPGQPVSPALTGWPMRLAKKVFGHVPDSFLSTAGKLLYKHVG